MKMLQLEKMKLQLELDKIKGEVNKYDDFDGDAFDIIDEYKMQGDIAEKELDNIRYNILDIDAQNTEMRKEISYE